MTRPRALVLLAGGLVLAACSSPSTDTTGSSTQTVTVTSVSSAEPVTATVTVSVTQPIETTSASSSSTTSRTSTSVTSSPAGPVLAGVSLAQPGTDVLSQLTELLGKPDSDVSGTGCSAPGTVSRELTWGGLTVYGEGPDKATVLLDSYTVAPGAPRAVTIPYGIRFGMTIDELQAALPPTARLVEDTAIGLPYFETPDGLFVIADGEFETFRVNPYACS